MANSIGFDPVAWSIDGGRHNGELYRVLAYASTAGTEGIVSIGDCRVHQLTTEGGQVVVDAGAVLIRNRSANVRNQTYVANGRSETRLDIRPTGAAPRSDLIVVRIEDPQYSPWPAVDASVAPTYQYVRPLVLEGVSANTANFWSLNLGYSGYALARVDIPANTSEITQAMIKDLRQVANPQRQRELFRYQPGFDTPSQEINDPNGLYQHWPSWEPRFMVPIWASHVVAIMHITGVLKPIGGDVIGDLRLEWCTPGTPGPSIGSTLFEEMANTDWRRVSVMVSGETNVEDDQGLIRSVRIGARRHLQNSATDAGATLRTMGGSNFVLDVEFQQRAS